MTTLNEFIEARKAEDERFARNLGHRDPLLAGEALVFASALDAAARPQGAMSAIENEQQLAAFFDRSLGPAREHSADLGYSSVYDAMTSSRCNAEDTCTMDPACPFVTGCRTAES